MKDAMNLLEAFEKRFKILWCLKKETRKMTESQDTPVTDSPSADANPAPAEPVNTAPEPAQTSDAPAPEALPDWFMKDKFKDMSEQARAYSELSKKMGKYWGVKPDSDYALDSIEGITPDDPMLNNLKPVLKEIGLSQEGFNTLVNGYKQATQSMVKQLEEKLKAELTPEEARTIQEVDSWIKTHFEEADQGVMRSWIVDKKDFGILNKIKSMIPKQASIPSTTSSSTVTFETVKQVQNELVKYKSEVNKGLRVKDKNFEKALNQRWREAYQRENPNA